MPVLVMWMYTCIARDRAGYLGDEDGSPLTLYCTQPLPAVALVIETGLGPKPQPLFGDDIEQREQIVDVLLAYRPDGIPRQTAAGAEIGCIMPNTFPSGSCAYCK